MPYPAADVLDLEAVGFDLLLEDVVLSNLLLQLRYARAVLSRVDLFLCKRSQAETRAKSRVSGRNHSMCWQGWKDLIPPQEEGRGFVAACHDY